MGEMDMKKYMVLISITVAAIAAILISGNIADAAVEVLSTEINRTDCENIVNSTGKLQYLNEVKVSRNKYCMTDELFVSEGDTVKKGDPLLTVYEIDDISKLTSSFPDAQKYMELLSNTEIGDDIAQEVKKYTVRSTIVSPADGTVTGLIYTKNSFVNKNNTIMKISDSKEICVKANISESYIEKIKEGQTVKIRFAALSGKQYTGKVIKIAEQAKQNSSLTGKDTVVEVTIKPDSVDKELRIGYTAECEIITSVEKSVLLLPFEYLFSDQDGEFVYCGNNGRAKKIYIKTGREYKNGIEVKSGLKEHDIVIRSSSDVSEGSKLSIKK